MFISYEYKNYLGEKDGMDIWEYELIDSEFGTVLGTVAADMFDAEVGAAVIQEYGKRNLNVAKNLVLAFLWEYKAYSWQSIQMIIDNNKKYNPLFPQYKENFRQLP
jgi:hypothetical protein